MENPLQPQEFDDRTHLRAHVFEHHGCAAWRQAAENAEEGSHSGAVHKLHQAHVHDGPCQPVYPRGRDLFLECREEGRIHAGPTDDNVNCISFGLCPDLILHIIGIKIGGIQINMNLEISSVLRVRDPRLEDVSEVVGRLIGFLRDQNVNGQKFLEEFELAAAEAINNAIEHGCAASEQKFLAAEVIVKPGEVELNITDPSAFPGWTGEATLPDDPLAEGGRGRFLMEQMTTKLEHRLRDGHHVLVMRKAFAPGTTWEYEPGQSEGILNAMTEELGSSYEMINALIGLGELLASADEMSLFMRLALARLCELTGAETAYVRIQKGAELVLAGQSGTQGMDLPAAIVPPDAGIESRVFASGDEMTVTSSQAIPRGDPLCGRIEAAFVAPIFFKNRRRGVLVIAKNSFSAFFTAAQLKVTRVVTEYLGIIFAMNELQQRRETEQRALRELEIAAEIQLSLMPQHFDRATNLDLFGVCEPALKAGGDYFDIVILPDGSVFVVIADVMGKGISAALLANMLRTNIRALIHEASDPGRLVASVNRTMAPDLVKLDMFITVACAWISPDRSLIREVNAGHPAGLIYHGARAHTALKSQGLPIGVLPETEYETHECRFEVGDCLLLFTDGIPEADNEDGEFFEVEGLRNAFAAIPVTTSEELVKRTLLTVDKFSSHAPPGDDRTMMVIIRKA